MKKKPSEMATQLTNLFYFVRWCQTPKEEAEEKRRFLNQFIQTYCDGDPSLLIMIASAFNVPLEKLNGRGGLL